MRRGLTFGSFDPLHYGHVRFLRSCSAACDHLTVVVHADARVATLKQRASVPLVDRMRDLDDLRTVDAVLPGDARTKLAWIAALHPDVVFVGEETEKWSWTVPTVVLPRTPGISSTALREAGV